MARIESHGLRRSVGLGGLFATAYGNVGSSIYYALGIVAAYALGLTPVIFMLAGGLFALTAKTYAEGAAMFPEAGGASSFARHAFHDLISFFAGWALSLDYILTIAISASFVPRDPGTDVPKAVNLILLAVLGVYAGMTVVALSALPVRGHGSHAFTLLGLTPQQGGYQNDPVLGIISHLGVAAPLQHILRYYVGA